MNKVVQVVLEELVHGQEGLKTRALGKKQLETLIELVRFRGSKRIKGKWRKDKNSLNHCLNIWLGRLEKRWPR